MVSGIHDAPSPQGPTFPREKVTDLNQGSKEASSDRGYEVRYMRTDTKIASSLLQRRVQQSHLSKFKTRGSQTLESLQIQDPTMKFKIPGQQSKKSSTLGQVNLQLHGWMYDYSRKYIDGVNLNHCPPNFGEKSKFMQTCCMPKN